MNDDGVTQFIIFMCFFFSSSASYIFVRFKMFMITFSVVIIKLIIFGCRRANEKKSKQNKAMIM